MPLERNGDGGVRRGVVEEMISEEMQDAMETGVVGATLKQISKCEYVMFVYFLLSSTFSINIIQAHEAAHEN